MKVSYFPGCTLKTKAKELDIYARRSAEALGIELCEIENWQCCGGVFVTRKGRNRFKACQAFARLSPRVTPATSACNGMLRLSQRHQADERRNADR